MCKSCKKTEVKRSMCLELADAKDELFALIEKLHTERKIPFYLIENLTNDAARQVSYFADAEREAAKQLYEKQFEGGGGNA